MTTTETIIDEPKRRFTNMRVVETPDERIQFTTCLDCGACIVIDPDDRKQDIHPIAIHIEWHEKFDKKVEAVDELLALLSGADLVEAARAKASDTELEELISREPQAPAPRTDANGPTAVARPGRPAGMPTKGTTSGSDQSKATN